MGVDNGTGTTLTFSSGFFAYITGLGWSGASRPSLDTSHFGTTVARSFIPGDLYDPGDLGVEILWDQDTTALPLTSTAETVTVTFPGGGTTTTMAASGFLTGLTWDAPLEGVVTGSGTIKFSGAITLA